MEAKKKLFFVASNSKNIKYVENFLLKRNFEVLLDSDLDSSLSRIISLQPDFIFLPLDHANGRIVAMINAINSLTKGVTVLFVQNNTKESIRKLEYSKCPFKLYPPMSGPAVERLVLKTIKANATTTTTTEIKSKEANLEVFESNFSNVNVIENQSNIAFVQKGRRGELLKTKNQQLGTYQRKELSEQLRQELKTGFGDKVKMPIADLIETYYDNGPSAPAGPSTKNFQEASSSVDNYEARSSTYCLTIQSLTWCGYLIIHADFEIDFSLAKNVFQTWLASHLVELQEFTETDQFQISITNPDYQTFAKAEAEYIEVLSIYDKEVTVSFFSVDPQNLSIDLLELQHIGIPVQMIPTAHVLPLNAFVYLPLNQKFLLFALQNEKVDVTKLQRLSEKSIEKLYTPIEFEKEFRALRAEEFLNSLMKKLSKFAKK